MLCDRLDVHTLVIAGLLSGTAPALTTALRLGKRVERVLLLSGRAPQATPDEGLNPLKAFRLRLQRHGWASPTIFRLLKTRVSPAMVARMLERATRNSPGDRDYLDAHPETARLVSAYVTEALAADGLGPSDELAATRHSTFDLSGLQASLLLFHGDEDSLAPLDELRRYLGQHPYGLTRFPRIGQLMTLKH